MAMDFSEKRKLKMSMVPFLKMTIGEFPEAITGTAATPAAGHLFKVRDQEDRKTIDEERARVFHHAVAQLLFVTLRCHKGIQNAVAFLSTRVKDPDEDDWRKLKRLLKYLRGTLYLPLILEIENLKILSSGGWMHCILPTQIARGTRGL